MKHVGLALVTALAVASCGHVEQAAQLTPSPTPTEYVLAPNVHCADVGCRAYNVDPYIRTRSKYGIGCMGNVPPGTGIPDEPPPQSYAVKDIGKPGFPNLTRRELAAVRRYVGDREHSTARLAWVEAAAGPHHMILFYDPDGPCAVSSHYTVLNGTCNEFYMPGESPYHTIAGSGCYPNDPRPQSVPTDRP